MTCSNTIYEMLHFPFDKVAITIFAFDRRRNIRAARRGRGGRLFASRIIRSHVILIVMSQETLIYTSVFTSKVEFTSVSSFGFSNIYQL